MAFVSAFTVIRFLSLFHLMAAYFLLVAPTTLVNQNIVVIMGEAMQIPETRDFSKASEVTSFAGLILGMLALTDLISASLPELTALEYWTTQVPVRLAALFAMTAYPLLFKAGGILGPQEGLSGSGMGGFATAIKRDRPVGELLVNDLVFTTGFVEVSIWFWVFIMLKDERKNLANRLATRQMEHDEIAKI